MTQWTEIMNKYKKEKWFGGVGVKAAVFLLQSWNRFWLKSGILQKSMDPFKHLSPEQL